MAVPQLGVTHCAQRKASWQVQEASDRASTMPLPMATPFAGVCRSVGYHLDAEDRYIDS